MKSVVVLGCGGHAAVVRDACETAGFCVIGFVVEEGMLAATPMCDVRPIQISKSRPIDAAQLGANCFALGIGANEARLWWAEKLLREGFELPAIVHARAWVSPSARLAAGAFVGAGAVVQAGACVEMAAVINTNATVEHHCQIGAGAHIAPGAVLAGVVRVGEQALVGAGASVRDRVAIGPRAVVGVNAAVVGDVAAGLLVAGVPAKPIA